MATKDKKTSEEKEGKKTKSIDKLTKHKVDGEKVKGGISVSFEGAANGTTGGGSSVFTSDLGNA